MRRQRTHLQGYKVDRDRHFGLSISLNLKANKMTSRGMRNSKRDLVGLIPHAARRIDNFLWY